MKAFLRTIFRIYVHLQKSTSTMLMNARTLFTRYLFNLWNKRDEIDNNSSLKSYLFKSVHNRCLNYIRDHKRIVKNDLPHESKALNAYIESTDYLEVTELEMTIKSAIDGLPDHCRRIFIMSRFEDMKYSEIAQELGVTVKAIEAQMSKALKILRTKLGDYLMLISFIANLL